MPDSARPSAPSTDGAPQATPVADGPTCDLSDTDIVALVEDAENNEHAGGLETCDSHNYEWYAEAERDMQAYLKRVEQQADAEAAAAEAAEPPPVVADDDDDEEEDEGFPGGDLAKDRTASFGGSWEDEPLADWQPEKILSRRRVKGATYYLVKWRSHADPTWEPEEDLEEEGHGKTLAEFNAGRRKKAAAVAAAASESAEGKKEAVPAPPAHVLSTPFDPTIYWTRFESMICLKFAEAGYTAEAIHNVCDGKRARAFTDKWTKMDSVPVMLCHGTRSNLLLRIIESGLRVPNQGANPIAVLNGSVHGVGIYTSRTPSVSDWYTRGCGVMLICAGLISGDFVGTSDISDIGNTVVFFRDDLILPCFLVRYTRARSGEDPPVQYHKTLSPETLRGYLALSNSPNPTPASISLARQNYLAGCAYAAQMEKDPATVSQGGCQPGMAWTKKAKTLTKKQLRAAPRSAKDAYKQGLLLQKRG